MTLTIDLPDEDVAMLNAKASAVGLSAEQCAQQILKQALESSVSRPSLPVRIRKLWADVPDEVRAKLPDDGASQHDHYIYGTPKRDQ